MAAFRAIIGAFAALTAYIWVTAPTFESQPKSNAPTFYVVFGMSLHATNEVFRHVVPALMASIAVGWVFNMVIYVLVAATSAAEARGCA
ncbi:hypothetical protein CTA2_2229 [Colletotrichum tanaceti]|uniref:Uncharacterized protein n=1 Tax=Colletotrichum tanaceti TaxID=1306861 RepID=A0A4V6DHQ9_9PEZI|nr:hypothetical protein CTA2_2229 [Colletotrichum tanaceti]TKW57486.1 hypothetical protein CTA1_9579 [Colletotrichum tanaceti]